MAETRRVLCVIPARGGSKRVPRKNVRPIQGVPALARTIGIVMASEVANRIVVSTDDEEVARVAVAAGAEVPFQRPVELADDHTPTAPVIGHAIEALRGIGDEYHDVLVVYPTAVLLSPHDLQTGLEAFARSGHDVAFSVCRFHTPIERGWRRAADGTGEMLQPEHALTRTQDLEISYFDAGQFYFGTADFWESGHSIGEARPLLIELPPWRTADIDTEDDLVHVERLLKADVHGTGPS